VTIISTRISSLNVRYSNILKKVSLLNEFDNQMCSYFWLSRDIKLGWASCRLSQSGNSFSKVTRLRAERLKNRKFSLHHGFQTDNWVQPGTIQQAPVGSSPEVKAAEV
jgi:hypothetical protein